MEDYKIVVCEICGQKLRVPANKNIIVTCPRCKFSFTEYAEAKEERQETKDNAADYPVECSDPNLYQVIRECVQYEKGCADTAEIMYSDVKDIEYLDACNKNIRDISALRYFTNLKDLNLSENLITDISPLSGLTELTDLDLGDNRIADISALANLKNLSSLCLAYNNLSDIQPLENLMNLASLYIYSCRLTDLNALRSLKRLRILDASYNNISDISVLGSLTDLEELRLSENMISDINILGTLAKLKEVNLSGNCITNTDVSKHLDRQAVFYCSDNPVLEEVYLQKDPSIPAVYYCIREEGVGWGKTSADGETAGSPESKGKNEAIIIRVEDVSGEVFYRTCMEKIGWMPWVKGNNVSGMIRKGLGIEAIQIRLSGEAAGRYDMLYRIYEENYGWTGWVKNGQVSGSEGGGIAVKAIEIKISEK